MWYLINAGKQKKPAYIKEEQLLHGMHKKNWSKEILVSN